MNYINIILSIEDNNIDNRKEVIEKKEYILKIIIELNKKDKTSINEIKDNISLLSEFKDRAKLNYKFVNSKKKKERYSLILK